MTSKIFRASFLVSIAVVLASLVLFTGFLYDYFEIRIIDELEREEEYIEYAIKENGADFFIKNPSGGTRVTLISPDGTVINDTAADKTLTDNHSERKEFQEAMQEGVGTSVRYSKTLTEKTIYYAKKLDNGNVLRISTTHFTLMSLILGLVYPMIFVLAFALILSLLLSLKVSKSVIKPINEIDPDKPDEINTYNELAPLIRKIVHQKETIAKQLHSERQKQEEFQLITENMSEGFLVIDKKTNLLSYNRAALALLGSTDTDGSVLTLNRTESFRSVIEKSLSGHRAQRNMTYEDKIYRLIANPVSDGNDIIGAVILIIDITEIEKREVLRREFTANVSHELKTPLTSILGFAELMKSGGTPEDTVIDFSNSIYDESKRLIALVSDIIKISELDERDDFTRENVDLYELSSDVIKRLADSAAKKNVSFKICGKNTYVFGVRPILDEMVYNLCDNAVKYNKAGGTVTITVSRDNGKIYITVADTGIGIPPSCQNRVFERFFRVDKGRSKAEGGTGLGLSIVKHGAQYHEAEISLESVPGEGTAVTVIFTEK